MLNLNHLRYFHTAARFKSVTKAAEHLSISQPSLSQQLTTFEESLGLELYYRNGRNFDLTPRGKALYEKTIGLFSTVDEITNFLTKNEQRSSQSYSIAVSDEIERPLISDIVSKLVSSKLSENIKYDIISKPQADIVGEFYDGKHDILIASRSLRRFQPSHTFNFPVKLVTSKSNELLNKITHLPFKGLYSGLGENLVLPAEGMSLRDEIDDFLSESKVEHKIVFESNILSCVSRAIKQGVGCGFLPIIYVYDELKSKKLTTLGPKNGFWSHQVFVYSKKEISNDEILQKIVTTIQNLIV